MEFKQRTQNCVFIKDDQDNKHCFSYGKEVAAIIDGEYIEYSGEKFDSVTSKQHKYMFRSYYGI